MEGVDEAGMCMLCPSPPTLAILPLSELAWKAWMKLGEHMLWPSPPPPLLYVQPLGEYAWKAWMKLGEHILCPSPPPLLSVLTFK